MAQRELCVCVYIYTLFVVLDYSLILLFRYKYLNQRKWICKCKVIYKVKTIKIECVKSINKKKNDYVTNDIADEVVQYERNNNKYYALIFKYI